MVYRASSGTARPAQRNPVFKNLKKKKNKNKQIKRECPIATSAPLLPHKVLFLEEGPLFTQGHCPSER
jgi:hypothetical protein